MNIYKTKDLGEASALITAGQRLADIERQGPVCYFIFANRYECEKISREYYFGELKLNARNFFNEQINLKHQIFSLK